MWPDMTGAGAFVYGPHRVDQTGTILTQMLLEITAVRIGPQVPEHTLLVGQQIGQPAQATEIPPQEVVKKRPGGKAKNARTRKGKASRSKGPARGRHSEEG